MACREDWNPCAPPSTGDPAQIVAADLPKGLPVTTQIMEDATEHLLLYVQKYADLLWKKRYLEVLKGVDIDDPTTLPHDQPDLHDRKTSDELKRLSRLSLDLRQARKSLAENEHAVRMAVRQTLLYETERDVVLLTRQYGRQLSIHLQDFATYLELYVTSSGAITSLMLLMLARLGVIKDALDDKIEKRWEDWQEAQQEFVKEQMKACQQDGSLKRKNGDETASSKRARPAV